MYRTSTIGKRAFAFTVDLLLLNLATIPLALMIGQSLLQLASAAVLAGLLYLFYFVLMEARYGQTLGKVSADIEVRFEGREKLWGSVVRNLTKAATAFFPLILLLDMVPMLFDEEKRRFTELMAGTRVVMRWKRSW